MIWLFSLVFIVAVFGVLQIRRMRDQLDALSNEVRCLRSKIDPTDDDKWGAALEDAFSNQFGDKRRSNELPRARIVKR